MEIGIAIVMALVGAAVGYFLSSSALKKTAQNQLNDNNQKADQIIKDARQSSERILSDAEQKAERIIEKAEQKHDNIKRKKIQEAKEHWSKLSSEFEAEKANKLVSFKEREMEVVQKESNFKQKQNELNAQLSDLENRESEVKSMHENLDKQLKVVQKKREELDKANEERIKALEKVAQLSQQEAKEQMLEMVRAKSESEAMAIVRETMNEAKLTANKEAKKLVIKTIQRMAAEYTIENTVSVFHLESDDMKGQIIGREGRNIRALEAATGVELIVDDTPEAIVISSFDPVRREIARLSLQRLVADGRIHPQRIEEIVQKTTKQLNEQIVEIGERTVLELDIHGLNANLIRMIGRMRFRSSYGQNLLKHSIETANLCAIMAAELGMSKKQIKMAKRAGLLHDIGKVAEEETELSHALLGMKLCEQYKEHPFILNAVGAHHDEIEMNNIISPIVQTCDAISGARPGARREILESYMKRIGELEEIAMGHDGVSKAFAMQAGRELRVIVESDKVSDEYADELSFKISSKIQDEMQYPGQIRVTVIREKRAVSFAR